MGVVLSITAVIKFLWVSAYCAKSVFIFTAETSQAFTSVLGDLLFDVIALWLLKMDASLVWVMEEVLATNGALLTGGEAASQHILNWASYASAAEQVKHSMPFYSLLQLQWLVLRPGIW